MKSGGSTPQIVKIVPERLIELPKTSGSPPKSCRQNAGTDAEGEDEDRDGCEAGILAELSKTVAEIGDHGVKPIANTAFANLFFHLFDAMTMPEDYETRLTEMFPGIFKQLRLFAADPYDFISSKPYTE